MGLHNDFACHTRSLRLKLDSFSFSPHIDDSMSHSAVAEEIHAYAGYVVLRIRRILTAHLQLRDELISSLEKTGPLGSNPSLKFPYPVWR